uniref:Cyclin-dependent kinase inhibitor 1B n=1 Tax=Esox lucius TaxID=8010 RepID=A0AAY5KZH6_ESOLU
MSNVRLSNGSPTLERTDARLSDHPKPTACRNLFGSVDHEELTRDLKGHLKEMEEAAAAKWNFDFSSHTPLLNGKYEWKKVDSKDIPTFYNTQQRSAKGIYPSGNNNVDLNGNHSCVLGTPRQPSENAERSETQFENKEQCTGQRKRPACHGTPLLIMRLSDWLLHFSLLFSLRANLAITFVSAWLNLVTWWQTVCSIQPADL